MQNTKQMRWTKTSLDTTAFLEVQVKNAWVYFKESPIYVPGHKVPGMASVPDQGFATMQNGLKLGYTLEPTLFIVGG